MKPTLEYVNRILAHEIGHFIASMLCFKKWGIYEPSEIQLELFESGEVEGRSNLVQQQEKIDIMHIANPPKFIAKAMYGCILESGLGVRPFSMCFVVGTNGEKDFQSIKRLLPFGEKKKEGIIQTHELGDKHVDQLRAAGIFKVLPNSLFGSHSLKTKEPLTIHDPLIQQNLEQLITIIAPHFYPFVEDIDLLLKKYHAN